MKKTITPSCLFFFFMVFTAGLATIDAGAQSYLLPENRIWAMNRNVGLDFTGSSPAVIHTALYSGTPGFYEEACASVCGGENQGLLFYTNGTNVWNNQHNLMPNGSNINGANILYNTVSTTQGAVIVLDPANNKRYYLFSMASIGVGLLFCNVVDMTLNGGLGDIVTSYPLRGIAFGGMHHEKMTVAAGCSNNLWVLTHDYYTTAIKAYQVTAAGVDTTPVVSNTGTLLPQAYGGVGVLKVNIAGDRLLCLGQGVELYDFDPATGTASNAIALESSGTYYGGCFSPDGSKVYVRFLSPPYNIFQYDLNDPNPALNKTAIAPDGSIPGDMKIGPDGKIYALSPYGYVQDDGSHYMSRINYPDNAGLACGYEDTIAGLHFYDPPQLRGMRANMPQDVIFPHTGPVFYATKDSLICRFPDSLQLSAAPGATGYTWDNVSHMATRSVFQRGIYWASYFLGCDKHIDTFRLTGEELPALSIVFQNNTFSTTNSFPHYQWYKNGQPLQGANGPTLTATGNGLYAVSVHNNTGCSDSAVYQQGTGTGAPLTLQDRISVYPNPAGNTLKVISPVTLQLYLTNIQGSLLRQSRKGNEISLEGLAPGLYLLRMEDVKGNLVKVARVVKQRPER